MHTFSSLDQAMVTQGGHILCLGAHCDDIDIGAGGTLLNWLEKWPKAHVTWVALTSNAERAQEFHAAAAQFLADASSFEVLTQEFRNGFFPYDGERIKKYFEELKKLPNPDIVLTHQRDDRHQDHRTVSELTWNTFRSHLILEYEIPKFDGELVTPNTYVPLTAAQLDRKIEILHDCYVSQHDKQWFDEELFRSIARLRGVECDSPSRYAEAFVGRKICL